MRLIDFNLSTADLQSQLPLYWEPAVNQLVPISAIQLQATKLVLQTDQRARPLTLDQFNARTKQVNGQLQLYVQGPDAPVLLFGYRLNAERLLFG